MEKYVIRGILLVIALTLIGLTIQTEFFNNWVDRGVWFATKLDLQADTIESVKLPSKSSVEIAREEQDEFYNHLLRAEFAESNWKHYGPTGMPIVIRLKGNKEAVVVWWGGSLFEYNRYGRQFLISSKEMGSTVEKYYGQFK